MPTEAPTHARRMAEIIEMPTDRAPEAAVEVTVSFSSTAPYERLRFNPETDAIEKFAEVLGHGQGEADFSNLNTGAAPVLKDHRNEIDCQVGTVVRAWIEGERGMARLRFSRSEAGEALAARVLSGDVRNVSVGYDRLAMQEDGESDGVPVVRVTRWAAREISFVAVPADWSVGHGRGAADGDATTEITPNPNGKARPMPEENQPEAQAPETRAAAQPAQVATTPRDPAPTPIDADALRREERARIADIEAAAAQAERAGSPMPREQVATAIRNGEPLADFNARVLAHLASDESTQARATRGEIGLTERERSDFSLARLLDAVAHPSDQSAARAAAFELEVVREGARAKRSRRSDMTIPPDILNTWGQRDASAAAMETTTAGSGGNLVPVEHRGGSFIESLVNRTSIMRAGATMLTGLTGDVDIPKQTGGSTAYWVPETGAGSGVSESTPTVGVINLTPHTIAAAITYTRKMRLQADPSVEAFVRSEIQRELSLRIDETALVGSPDADAPSGLADFVNATNWNTASTYTWAEVVEMQAAIEDANADTDALRFICRGSTYHAMRQVTLESGAAAFLAAMGEIDGVTAIRSNQAGASQLFLGAFPQFIVGMFSGLDLRFDPITYAASDGHVVRVFQDLDFDVRHVESFALKENA